MQKPKLNMDRPTATKARTSHTGAKAAAKAIEDGEARLTVNLPIEAHRKLKAHAAIQGKTIRDYIIQLLQNDGVLNK